MENFWNIAAMETARMEVIWELAELKKARDMVSAKFIVVAASNNEPSILLHQSIQKLLVHLLNQGQYTTQ